MEFDGVTVMITMFNHPFSFCSFQEILLSSVSKKHVSTVDDESF